jgi:orotidine-5'-phosphate decarboxylase
MKEKRLIVALDVENLKEAEALVRQLSGVINIFKVGSSLFTSCGPGAVEMIKRYRAEVFLDLKFCDIPKVVYNAVLASKRLGVYMLTVHTLATSRKMLEAAASAAQAPTVRKRRPLILGVTILTSLDRGDLAELRLGASAKLEVLRLARKAEAAGLDGIVCSAQEASYVRKDEAFGENFLIVTPGVRSQGWGTQDQRRVATPREAVLWGADFIVVGRPIIQAPNPLKAAREIIEEIRSCD